MAGIVTRVKEAFGRRWAALKRRWPWLAHVVAAWKQLSANNGGLYAAAITYFSFLALFPLLLLAVAITGFVLHAHPAAQQSLLDHISEHVPGTFGTTLRNSVRTAIDARAGVGIIGLLGVLLTGLGWVANLRAAVDAVWGRPKPPRNPFTSRLTDLGILLGLGLGMLASLGLTTAGTAVTGQLVRAWHLTHVSGIHALLTVAGIAIAVLGDVAIFWWLIARLPDVAVSRRLAVRAAVLAAVGFEVLKVIGTVTIAKTAHSPTAGPFAGVVAILVWLQLVSRYLLFCVAWTATAHTATQTPAEEPISADPVGVPVREPAAEQQQDAKADH